MTPGPKPKPIHLKLIEGNPGKRPLPATPMPEPKAPDPPPELEGDGLAEWERVAPQLERLGLLSHLDRAALAAYCWAWARLLAAGRVLAESTVLIRKDRRIVKNPAIQVARDAAQECRAWAAEFGMTPSARARMTLPDQNPGDDLERLLQ